MTTLPRFDHVRLHRPGPTWVMGIVNVTPDSFSDGGRYLDPASAIAHGLELAAAGADLLDIGGESTRPGSDGVDARTELDRVMPVIRGLAGRVACPLSIDSTKPAVVEQALQAGVTIINDISGLRRGDELAQLAARFEAGLVLMHSRGLPGTMQRLTAYTDLLPEVRQELSVSADRARAAGVARERIILDPGIGFAKDVVGNLTLLHRLQELRSLGFPLLVGPSRKSFIGAVTGQPPGDRLMGTAAACVAAILHGARILRVHDVASLRPAIRVADAIRDERMP